MISSVPATNYLFKGSNWSTRIRCENCSRLRMKILERCQWRHSSVFIVNYEHSSSFVLIVEFEQANVCWVYIEKKSTLEVKIEYIKRYVAIFSVWSKLFNKWHLNLYHHNPTSESVRKIWEGVYFRSWFWLKRCRLWLFKCSKTIQKIIIFLRKKYVWFLQELYFSQWNLFFLNKVTYIK